MKKTVIARMVAACVVIPGFVQAGQPMQQVKETSERILTILRDPDLPEGVRRQRIRNAVEGRFDWQAMARRSLGHHWRDLNEDQRADYINEFSRLLKSTYLAKVENYSGEDVAYRDEKQDGDYARVSVEIISDAGTTIPVRYRLKQTEDQWLAYDVVIEGVSLVSNYRSQFNSILSRSSFDELMRKIRQKVQTRDGTRQ